MSAIDTTTPALREPRRRLLYWAGGGAGLAAVALADLQDATIDARDHVSDDVANHVAEQRGMARAADGFAGTGVQDGLR